MSYHISICMILLNCFLVLPYIEYLRHYLSPTASTTSPPLCGAETNVQSNLTGVKKSMHFLGLLRTLIDFLNLLRTIGLLQLTWRQAGLPDGVHMPCKFTWSTNTSCRLRFCSSFKVSSATLWPSI